VGLEINMVLLFKNNSTRIALISIFLLMVSFGAFFLLSETTHAQQSPGVAAADIKPATSELSMTTVIGQFIGNFILYIASGFLYMGGMLLELSIQQFILQLGSLLTSTGIGNSIDTTWRIVRDIANLAFIFGFIYIGIRTIIDSDSSSTKRMLASIIIGALLINFSLFFTKVIIDASNYIAVEIYNSLASGSGSIAQKFADIMGVVTFYKPISGDTLGGLTTGGNIFFYFMGSIFLIVAGFVLAAGGVLLIVRFVKLIFIMIFSPVLFAASVFPQTQATASKLWHELINYSFFAPAYLLLLLVSITMLQGFMNSIYGTNVVRPGFSDVFSGQTSAFGVVINFIVAIMFLIMSLQIAMKFGIAGADRVMAIGKDLRGRSQKYLGRAAGSATFGVAGAAGRSTVGRYASKLSQKTNLLDTSVKGGLKGFAARQILKSSSAVADSSFDARNVAGAGKTLGIGEGRKGGYTTVKKEIEEEEMKIAKSLGEVGDDDPEVAKRKETMEIAKKTLDRERQFLQQKMRSTDEAERKKAQTDLAELEQAHKDAEEAYGREKQRRVLGSAANIDAEKAVKSAKIELDTELNSLKEIQKQALAATTEAEREMFAKMSASLYEQVATAKKKYKTAYKAAAANGGYASVREDSGLIASWVSGRLVGQNKEAGKAVRKAFEKKIKKSKEDSRHEELVNAGKAAAPKDDH